MSDIPLRTFWDNHWMLVQIAEQMAEAVRRLEALEAAMVPKRRRRIQKRRKRGA